MNSEAEYAVLISKGKVLIQACRGETPRLPRPDEVSLQTGPSMEGRFRFGHPIDAEAIAVVQHVEQVAQASNALEDDGEENAGAHRNGDPSTMPQPQRPQNCFSGTPPRADAPYAARK